MRPKLAEILYNCAEAIRVASVLLSPAMPTKMASFWALWGCGSGGGCPARVVMFGGPHRLKPGNPVTKGEPLFMRADAKLPEPA